MPKKETKPNWYRKAEFFVVWQLNREINSDLTRWRNGLREETPLLTLAFAALSMSLLLFWAFDQGWWFTALFLLAASVAILRGHVLSHPLQLFGVGLAVSIGFHLLPELRSGVWQTLWDGEFLGALVLAGAYWYFRDIKIRLERGEMGEELLEDDFIEDDDVDDDDFDDGL